MKALRQTQGTALAKTELAEPFAERVDRLARELELAIRWDRPSILLAVYRSTYVMNDAAAALAARLREERQQVIWVRVNSEADADVPLRLAEHPQRNEAVFFVSGLQWGGKTALRALNIRREYFVDERLRAVFWLTESEAVAIARQAPDFWAFRHRVVEFVEPPEPGRAAVVAREMAWWGFEDRTLYEDTQAKIALREMLLADLPEGDEALAARAELLFTLGGLYWADRQYERAEESFRAALKAAQRTDNTRLEVWCHNSLGNIYHALNHRQEAVAEFQRAIELDPQFALPHNGLGDVYRDLGRYDEAVAEYQRAIELDPKDSTPHHGLGNVYYTLGRYDEAVAEYQQAIERDPNAAASHNNLADVYMELGQLEEARREFEERVRLSPDDALNAHVSLGIIACHQGKQVETQQQFEQALSLWGTAWTRRLQTPATLLVDKAVALLGLGRVQEALDAMQEARRRLLPGDRLEEYIKHLELLTTAPEPLEGLDEVLALLREAAGWRGLDLARRAAFVGGREEER